MAMVAGCYFIDGQKFGQAVLFRKGSRGKAHGAVSKINTSVSLAGALPRSRLVLFNVHTVVSSCLIQHSSV